MKETLRNGEAENDLFAHLSSITWTKGDPMSPIRHYSELNVYKSAMDCMVKVFAMIRLFPAAEKFSLTNQIRRSPRSVCANLGDAWRERRYKAAFIAKLNDAEAEAAETQVHAEIALRTGYITQAQFDELDEAYNRIIGQLVKMADQSEKWLIRPRNSE